MFQKSDFLAVSYVLALTQRTTKCTKEQPPRAARLFSIIQPTLFWNSGVLDAKAFIIKENGMIHSNRKLKKP